MKKKIITSIETQRTFNLKQNQLMKIIIDFDLIGIGLYDDWKLGMALKFKIKILIKMSK